MSTEKKMLMFEWICHHLDMNTFAEMRYMDETKNSFQVPWIHKSNRKWNKNAAAVFKAWAEYKGKEENFSFTRAKTNFRMAMKYQPNIKEITRPKKGASSDKSSGRATKRKSSEVENCVKMYQIVHIDPVVKKKLTKTHEQSSTSSDRDTPDCSSLSLTATSLPSTSSQRNCENAALPVTSGHHLTVTPGLPCSEDPLESFDPSVSSEFAGYTTPNIFDDYRNFLPDDGDFVKLPSYQELVGSETPGEISKPYGDPTRYLPLQPIYESISDPVVSSTDDSYKTNCSPGHSSDEASSSGESFSLYSYTRWSQDLESQCQVSSSTNYTDDGVGCCFSDIEAFERMETYVEELLLRNFGWEDSLKRGNHC